MINPKTILIAAANPANETRLRLDVEVRDIDEGLRLAKHRDLFELKQQWATRVRDLRRAMNDNQPTIVHFCGHGAGEEGIVLEDNEGKTQLVSTEALANFFELFADEVECVVLNACFSEAQAKEIVKHIPYVIGMNKAIGDKAAIEFAVAFYDSLAAGKDYEKAYKFGCNAIELAGRHEALTPVLLKKSSTPPDDCNSKVNLENSESPEGTVPLDSPFYVERPPIESDCYRMIERPYALICVKAPRQMGKSSLLARILNHAQQHEQRTVWLSFQKADSQFFETLESLLKWFCAVIADNLELPDRLAEIWKGDILGAKDKATNYFQRHLLKNCPILTLGLDEVDEVFKHEKVACEFFSLLRAWHEESKSGNAVWKNFRLIITHSKEVYLPLNVNQSPFNVGSPVELPEFTTTQIKDLLQRYQLNWTTTELENFIQMVGGHPYLVRLGLHKIAHQQLTLTEFLRIAPTEEGPYSNHLRHHLHNLQTSELTSAARQIMTTHAPLLIDDKQAFKLKSMGLVRLQGNQVEPLCQLYRLYFQERLNH